jgi:hypothetical protein
MPKFSDSHTSMIVVEEAKSLISSLFPITILPPVETMPDEVRQGLIRLFTMVANRALGTIQLLKNDRCTCTNCLMKEGLISKEDVIDMGDKYDSWTYLQVQMQLLTEEVPS